MRVMRNEWLRKRSEISATISRRMSSKCCACQRNMHYIEYPPKITNSLCLPRKTNRTHKHMHTETRHIQKMLCLPRIKRISKTHSVPKGMERRYRSQTVANSCGCYPTHLRIHLSPQPPNGNPSPKQEKNARPWSFRSIVLHSASTAFGDACSDSLPGSGEGDVETLQV